jgi:GNAT superfamily N-acetyltransferase
MNRLELVPFADERLVDASRLLAARHARHRALEPLLDPRFEDPAEVLPVLEHLWREEDMSGSAALHEGALVGNLIGTPQAPWRTARTHATSTGMRPHAGLQAHGYREVPRDAEVQLPAGCEIRKPEESMIDDLIELDFALPRTAVESRHFHGLGLPERRTSYLAYAATLRESRGRGIGVTLTNAGFAWAAREGYEAMVTGRRVTNLLPSRFWPSRGFRTSVLRLYRSIP